jgi:hypothetical protein
VEIRALAALGELDEAARLAARVEKLSPSSFQRLPVVRIDPPGAPESGPR